MEDKIVIKGARVHNLKNVSLEIPKNKMTVFTGVSGSGKSSLAFDTIFAEGQRRYIESLSPYARQFLGQMERADVDEITGLSPAIAIGQKALSHNPRSIVGTLTEIYDYLRVLYARLGEVYCPTDGTKIEKLTPEEMVDIILGMGADLKEKYVTILSPVVRGRKGEYYQMLYDFLNDGFDQARVDGKLVSLHDRVELSRYKVHDIDIVMDRVMISDETRLFEAVENALQHSKGLAAVLFRENKKDQVERLFSSHWSCPTDGFSFPEIEPRLFSFNSPAGACPTCGGLGKTDLFLKTICPDCQGKRLKPEALSVRIKDKNIYEVSALTIADAHDFFKDYEKNLNERHRLIAHNVVKEINDRLKFLLEVGLDYITLIREAETLSGGEAQRIRLASQIGSHLSNTLYVLDEPTIGLHERDTERLVKTLKNLRDENNTVIIVEHDERTIKDSDYLIDLGPMAGELGGEVVFAGPTKDIKKTKDSRSLTLKYLNEEVKIEVPRKRRWKETEEISIVGARAHNLKNINVKIPLRKLVCISGVSGGGKSSLLYDVLYENMVRIKSRFKHLEDVAKITGSEYVDKVIIMDQSPIGRTPRSNPATYTGIFTPIRDFYASLEDSRMRGYTHSRFSFNRAGGRCEACQGAGFNTIEMHFMPEVEVPCEVCHGKRFSRETLQVKHKGKNISDVLEMTVNEATKFFENNYLITDKLKVLQEVGLGYLRLGQSATTLSGGEAQRIKLARELTGPLGKKTMYLLDEPTVGLHYHDIELLLRVLNKLVDKGNSVIIIEHNLHILKCADYIIDLGPEGGAKGGTIVAKGTPEEVGDNPNSYTGMYLKEYLD
ncbi:MAG: excinuclease ABC subunit A [Parcubacteria group bacterium Gr01-1014_13]|nr:MAG: excinuclease ABC subunit A [Parcubacteria group bacterium Gr01-1014_13]